MYLLLPSIFISLQYLKKIPIILTLVLFSLSTMVMPYANFDDTRSLKAVYNNCLQQDADMDLLEFVGEKLLVAGFDHNEENKEKPPQPRQPVDGSSFVQIQSGAFYQPFTQELNLEQPVPVAFIIPLTNTAILPGDFHPGIFHPPSVA